VLTHFVLAECVVIELLLIGFVTWSAAPLCRFPLGLLTELLLIRFVAAGLVLAEFVLAEIVTAQIVLTDFALPFAPR
jgi:hypothetical protein